MTQTNSGNVQYAVPAPPIPSLAVVGSDLRYPVRRIHCVGRNYLAHVRELGNDEKMPPLFFAKAPDMIVETGSTIPYPIFTQNYHYEIELVVAMKSGGTNIPVEQALDHVYGYAIGLDMTRRDVQQAAAKAGRPWEVGKSFDQSAPCGPVYPASAVGHITSGHIDLKVNGNVKQESDINNMMWDVAHIIHHLSLQVAICPGDLIFTGTPEGVGPVVAGDEMVGSIDKLGELRIKIS
ncbi:MAG: fumarylacetoacetate hydrolase family protein [Bryobacteraceae bacterium]